MRVALTLVACLFCRAAAGEWTPPANPNPQAILQEAQADARARNYEAALAKHVWFHEHALEFNRSLTGVRLSFALGDWMALADAYPPALEKLKETREATRLRLDPTQGGRPTFEDFQALESINEALEEDDATVAAFRLLDEHKPRTARRAFPVALRALVQAKEYKVCGKYVDAEISIPRMIELLQVSLETANRLPRGGEVQKAHAKKRFVNEAWTLVALLVVNERQYEAEKAALKLRKVEGDEDFQSTVATALAEALEGKFPDPWP
jgi:hypothetical protein